MSAPDPRLLSREQAAAYCGVMPSTFSLWVTKGKIPRPVPGTHRWDRKALDLALDKFAGIETKSDPASEYDIWKAKRNARRA